ncbi:MAG: non-homologous end-joining DNA ligase [Acidimicrobiia bacterium]|nr:non-homologous end-joining DNA ligase [Acidimicrobiia bacterium]
MQLHFPVSPMKATLGSLPTGDGWAYEIKWDGYRTLAFVDGDTTRLQSTSGRDVSERWSELGSIAGALNARSAILDAELVVLDDDGRPRFELVQQSGPGGDREAVLYLFDVLSIDGTDTVDMPYEARRALLDDLVEPGDNWTTPNHRIGDGVDLVAATQEQGLEGVIAKKLGSTYRPGARTKDWLKIKNRRRVEVVIGGFTAGDGNRSTTFGSLLVGRLDGDRLAFAGGVGTGFDHRTLEMLARRMRELRTAESPFDPAPPSAYRRHATWIEPVLVAAIEIAEFTNDGFVRHASFVELEGPGGR